MMKKLLYVLLLLFATSCNVKEEKKTDTKLYFDVEGYFNGEALRLSKSNKQVKKEVAVDGKMEQKKLSISDWKKEFQSFIDSDINKASWKEAFTIAKQHDLETYTSDSDKIPVKKLVVGFKNGKVKSLRILIKTQNYLYTSEDSLAYFPDSLYQINKSQKIKLMDEKKYQIIGKFE